MPETIVPYAKFLEIRQRRQRVVAELRRRAVATATGDPLATGSAEDGVGPEHERALSAAVWNVRPAGARDRDAE